MAALTESTLRMLTNPGTDFAAPDGTPILAAADGTVTVAEFSGGYGGLIVIEHTIGGKTVTTAYAHMWQSGIHVRPGDRVSAGQHGAANLRTATSGSPTACTTTTAGAPTGVDGDPGRIGQQPSPAQLDAGWKVSNWMKDNADVLGVEYLIWQG